MAQTYTTEHLIDIAGGAIDFTNDMMIRECLNIEGTEFPTPKPVNLYSTDPKNRFCLSLDSEDQYASFTCDLYGKELIWMINDETVAVYTARDIAMLEDIQKISVEIDSTSNPLSEYYTAYKMFIDIVPANESVYRIPKCNSTLVIRPVNQSYFIPFSVTCQTFCDDTFGGIDTDKSVCQTQEYVVIGKYYNYYRHLL